MSIYEKFLIKDHSLHIEEIPICIFKIVSLRTKSYVKTPNNLNNQDIAHYAPED